MHTSVRPLAACSRRFVLAMLLMLPAACTADTATAPSSATKPAATVAATKPLENAPFVVLFDATPMTLKGKPFTIEIAKSDTQIQRGLMYRDTMPADQGMLFLLPEEEKAPFWMHNTRIPLDIIFLDKTGKVIEIHDRKPFDDTGMGPATPALYVIELNAGTSQKIGLKKGDTIEIPAKYVKN